jgi:single-stranded-DNA-specific exonuclease
MKRWIVLPKKSDDIIKQLLIDRGIKDKESFLNPDFTRDLLDPYLIKDMAKAVKRIKQALKNGEKIGIVADYDADGIPGAAILYKTLWFIGTEAYVYIPSRDDGYGLSKKGVDELAKSGCKLLITIDLGIVNKCEVEYAIKLGLDVIITDHHEIQKRLLPQKTVAILHTHLSPKYKNQNLSGAGVAYKLAQALVSKLTTYNLQHTTYLKWLLDLAAISTICDIVPLTGENRVIAKYGLMVLNKTKNIGLKCMYAKANILDKNIDTYVVGFLIGPRINAPGRMKDATASFKLLTTKNIQEAETLAGQLEKSNQHRQEELKRTLEEARAHILKHKLHQHKIILIAGEGWSSGIIGLVAGKLMEEYCRPVIIFNKDGETLKGSARSIEKFHILDALEEAKFHLTKFGGHARAAGLTLENKNFDMLYEILRASANKKIADNDLIAQIKIDAIINPKDINFKLIDILKKFEPFGLGNPRPVFLMKDLEVTNINTVGTDKKHLKLNLASTPYTINHTPILETIGFGLGNLASTLTIGEKIDIVFTIDENVWNGSKKIQLKILDLRKGSEKE